MIMTRGGLASVVAWEMAYVIFNLDERLTGEVQCEQPNNSLYTFTGNLIVDKQTIPLSPNQLLLRVSFFFFLPHVLSLSLCIINRTEFACSWI